jgi:hypothetical protein
LLAESSMRNYPLRFLLAGHDQRVLNDNQVEELRRVFGA